MRALLPLLILTFSVSGFAEQKKIKITAGRFCENLSMAKRDSQTLESVRQALEIPTANDLGVHPKNALKANSSNDENKMKAYGFENLLDKNPKLLADQSQVPTGAIFILDKSHSANCPVKGFWGGVAVKCEPDSLSMANDDKQKLSEFIQKYPGCIAGVMYPTAWTPDPKVQEANVVTPAAGR